MAECRGTAATAPAARSHPPYSRRISHLIVVPIGHPATPVSSKPVQLCVLPN